MMWLWMWAVLLRSLRRTSPLRHQAPTTTPPEAPEAQVSHADERWPKRRPKGQQCFPALSCFHPSCDHLCANIRLTVETFQTVSKWPLYMIKHLQNLYRYIQQVNQAAITIQRWYRRQANRKRANENTIKHLLASKKKVMYFTQGGL